MNIQVINPLSDRRWDEFVAGHPNASPFHERGWLEALQRTYGYEPMVLTSTAAGEALQDGLALCRVSSWFTGTRLVSLPFADHCEPLLNGHNEFAACLEWLRRECDSQRCQYFEMRALASREQTEVAIGPSHSFCHHLLDIRAPETELFERLHKDSIQRKIRRAEREKLRYATGRSKEFQDEFYRLLLLTRRRHLLPPQPRTWFKNLIDCMGEKALIRVAQKNGLPLAALLTLRHGSCVVYKYGCSDERYHNLGGMPLLFWRLIQESKGAGISSIDLGRSELDNEGLVVFKNHLGASKKPLIYYRYPAPKQAANLSSAQPRGVRHIFAFLPDSFLSLAGRLLYRHMG